MTSLFKNASAQEKTSDLSDMRQKKKKKERKMSTCQN